MACLLYNIDIRKHRLFAALLRHYCLVAERQ